MSSPPRSGFRDPEGLFYLARHLAHLGEGQSALGLLERVVSSGYVCYPSMARDPWLESLRKKPAFATLQRRAETLHQEAADLLAARSIPRRTSSGTA